MAQPPADMNRALEGVAEFFRSRQTRAGVVARRLLGAPAAGDDTLTLQLINERRRRTRMDGGVGGWVAATTFSAWELIQLGCPPDHTGLSRMLGYILDRQDKPGRFGEGCSERRHAIGHCHHYIGGFFSPGSKDEIVAPLALPSGAVFTEEWDARFAGSCFALRTALQARQERREAVRRHVESLVHLAERWDRQKFAVAPDTVFAAIAAVGVAPLPQREQAEHLADRLIADQRGDGTWENASLFHAIDALLTLTTETARLAVERATKAIIEQQRPNGSFDDHENEERALIALRALWALGMRRATPRPPRLSPAALPVRHR